MFKGGNYNFGEFFRFLSSKKINPWFWIFSVVYLLVYGYFFIQGFDSGASGDGMYVLVGLFFAPYALIAIIYLSLVPEKKPAKKKR